MGRALTSGRTGRRRRKASRRSPSPRGPWRSRGAKPPTDTRQHRHRRGPSEGLRRWPRRRARQVPGPGFGPGKSRCMRRRARRSPSARRNRPISTGTWRTVCHGQRDWGGTQVTLAQTSSSTRRAAFLRDGRELRWMSVPHRSASRTSWSGPSSHIRLSIVSAPQPSTTYVPGAPSKTRAAARRPASST
jgi:hypothetical protein